MNIYQVYLGLLLLIMIGNLFLCLYVWRNRHIPSAKFLIGALLSGIQICLMFFILTVSPSEEIAYFSARARFLGLSVFFLMMMLWALDYTQHGAWITRTRVALLCVVPVMIQIVMWLTPGHTEFLKDWTLIRTPEGYNVEYRILAGFHDVYAIYSIFAMAVSFGLLIHHAAQVEVQKRAGLIWILLGGVISSSSSILPVTLGHPPGLRLLPISLGVMTATIAWALIRYNIYSIMPVAYDLIYHSMSDAVLVINTQHKIVRANPAAEKALGVPRRNLLKQAFAQIMPKADAPLLFTDELVRFEAGGAGRSVYLGKCMPIKTDGHLRGWLMVLHDVTAKRRAEAELSASEQRATALAQAVEKATSDHEREQSLIIAEFARMTIHQFREPIQRLDATIGAISTSEVNTSLLAQIEADTNILSDKVNDMLKIITPPAAKP